MKKIEFKLEVQEKIYYPNLAVYFNGWLMNNLDSTYVEYLHSLNLNPYNQSVRHSNSDILWEINILDENVATPILNILENLESQSIELRALSNSTIQISNRKITEISKEYFADIFYRTENSKYLNLVFATPTSFKQDNNYILYPDSKLLIQNVMLRFQNAFQEDTQLDMDFLQELSDSLNLQGYNLSTKFIRLHRNNMYGYTGSISYRIDANESIRNYISMLMAFAEYSGIGIKTSLGMGKVILENNAKE